MKSAKRPASSGPKRANRGRTNSTIDTPVTQLLAAHQAIIDAWYAKWRKEQRERLDRVFAKKRTNHDTM